MQLCAELRGLPETDAAQARRQRKRDLQRADSLSEPPAQKYKVDTSDDDTVLV